MKSDYYRLIASAVLAGAIGFFVAFAAGASVKTSLVGGVVIALKDAQAVLMPSPRRSSAAASPVAGTPEEGAQADASAKIP